MGAQTLVTCPRVKRLPDWRIMLCVAGALACGGAIRLHQAWSTSVISQDGIGYVKMARAMEHDWRACIPDIVQFGYPLLIKWSHALIGAHLPGDELMRWQRAAQCVSVLGGTLCIPAIYWLGRRLLSPRVGLLAAWCWAFLPDAVRFSADVLSDMPCLSLMLWGTVAVMLGLRKRTQAPFLWAGILSGAAYTLRAEGGEIAFVGTLLALTSCRGTVAWRINAAVATVAGFAVLGGSYIWLEGGSILSEKPFLQVQSILEPCRTCLAAWVGTSAQGVPMLAELDTRPFIMQLKDVFHISAGDVARPILRSLYQLTLQMGNSLNGVWLILGLVYGFLPHRKRLRRIWRRAPLTLAAVHTIALILLFTKSGYLTRRHVMLLDVGMMILAAGTLTWLAQRITVRVHRSGEYMAPRKVFVARHSGAIIAGCILMSTLPWLLRDVGDGRGHVHQAAAWIQEQFPGRCDVRIVAQHDWVPFYAGQTHWDLLWPDVHTCRPLPDAELLIVDRHPPAFPTIIDIADSSDQVQLTAAAKFSDPRDRRSVTIYRVQRISAASSVPAQ